MPPKKKDSTKAFAPARVRALALSNSDVGRFSAAALASLGKGAELFLQRVCAGASQQAQGTTDQALTCDHLRRAADAPEGAWFQAAVLSALAAASEATEVSASSSSSSSSATGASAKGPSK